MIANIETEKDAEDFIYNYSLYQSKADNQTDLYDILKKCEALAIQHNNKKLLCTTWIFITAYYTQINDLENALQLCLKNKSFSQAENLEAENRRICMRLIEIYLSLGDYANLEENIIAFEKKLSDQRDYGKLCSLNIIKAIQASNLKDYKACLEYNNKAVEYANLSGNLNLVIYAYNNTGHQLMEAEPDVARIALEKGLEVIKKNKGKIPVYSEAIVQLNSSRSYLKQLNISLSKKLIHSSIRKLQSINNKNEINYALLVQAEIYMSLNQFKKAISILQEVEKNCVEQNNRSVLITCYKDFIQLYENKKKYKDELAYYKKFQALNEELFNEESSKKIRNLQITNEVESIKRQRDHAEAIANLKHDFLANMSHEIRTPINSVLGICYLLQQDELNEKQLNYIHRLQRSGENLLGLINDILDISKIEADKMELVPVDFNLKVLLEDAWNQMEYKTREKGLNFILDIDPSLQKNIKGDAGRLMQILINLLSNSIKFTKEGSITLKAFPLKKEKDSSTIRFEVIDTGIGIAADKLDKIFERYEQAAATIKTQFGGTGLGLSISRKLTELMGGRIIIESEEGKGTIFSVEIPFEKSDKQATQAVKLKGNNAFLQGKKILIADDMEENRIVMRDILTTFNKEIIIEEARNGNEVLEKVDRNYDLILMDLDMPDRNGLEAMQVIRKSGKYHPKIIAHTASLLSMTRDELIECGFNELLTKPFKPEKLLEQLHTLIK